MFKKAREKGSFNYIYRSWLKEELSWGTPLNICGALSQKVLRDLNSARTICSSHRLHLCVIYFKRNFPDSYKKVLRSDCYMSLSDKSRRKESSKHKDVSTSYKEFIRILINNPLLYV